MIIYIDIIFLENLIMNYFILYVTSKILKKKEQKIRLVLSSLIGSIYAIVLYINVFKAINGVILKMILSIIMVQIAFNPKKVKDLFKWTLYFYAISFAFGGTAFFLLYYISPKNVKMVNGTYIGMYPIIILFIAIFIATLIQLLTYKLNQRKSIKDEMYGYILLNEKIKLLVDTGNFLKEPITGEPVIVIERNTLRKYYSKSLLEYIDNIMKGGTGYLLSSDNQKEISKIRIIPYSSIGKENGILVGIRENSIIIEYQNNLIEVNNVILAIYDGKILRNNCKGILGVEILERGRLIDEDVSSY